MSAWPDPPATLFSEPWDLSDIILYVEGRPIYANKTVLSMWSPVLRAMFTGDFIERNALSVRLPDKMYDDILELVRVLHPPNRDINEKNVCVLLPLAREYQVDDVTKRCEQFLICKAPSVCNLVLAEEFGLKGLHKQCTDYIQRSTLKTILSEPKFESLQNDTKIQILLDKSTKYERLLCDLSAVVSGDWPEQIQFRVGGMDRIMPVPREIAKLALYTWSEKLTNVLPLTASVEYYCGYHRISRIRPTQN